MKGSESHSCLSLSLIFPATQKPVYLSLPSRCELRGQELVLVIWSFGVHLFMRSNLLDHMLSSKSLFCKMKHFSSEKAYMIWKCLLSAIMSCSSSWSCRSHIGSSGWVQGWLGKGTLPLGALPCSLGGPSHLFLHLFLSSTAAITNIQHCNLLLQRK